MPNIAFAAGLQLSPDTGGVITQQASRTIGGLSPFVLLILGTIFAFLAAAVLIKIISLRIISGRENENDIEKAAVFFTNKKFTERILGIKNFLGRDRRSLRLAKKAQKLQQDFLITLSGGDRINTLNPDRKRRRIFK